MEKNNIFPLFSTISWFRPNIATNQFFVPLSSVIGFICYITHTIQLKNLATIHTWPKFVPLCNRKIDENLSIQYDIFSQDSFHFQSIKRDLILSFWFGVKSMLKTKTSLSALKSMDTFLNIVSANLRMFVYKLPSSKSPFAVNVSFEKKAIKTFHNSGIDPWGQIMYHR